MKPATSAIPRSDAAGATAWYAVVILTVAYMLSYIDRQLLALMVGPIRADLGISDSQFSLLHGLAFALFYTILGIPIGRLADATNRRNLIAAGVAFWSAATAACAVVKGFGQLFLARIGVGVGEAALSPAAYSMLADYFPKRQLGRAIGIYSSGVFIGIGLSFIIGSLLLAWLEQRGGLTLPWVGNLSPWRATFVLVGLPGVLLAVLVMTLTEPVRAGAAQSVLPIADVVARLRRYRRMYLLHFVGFSMLTLLFNGIMAWAAEFFIRIHDLERASIGPRLGLMTVFFGGSGIICGGLASDYLAKRGYADAPIRAALIAATLLVPVAVAAPLVPDTQAAFWLFGPLLFLVSFPFGPAAAGLQLITPSRMRAQVSAVYLFVVNLTGIGFGGTAVALMTDFVYRSDEKLHLSMATVAGVGGLLAVILLALALKPCREIMSADAGANPDRES